MKTKTLISFLGKTPKSENGYQEAQYKIDNHISTPQKYFGLSLAEYKKIDRMVLIGTSGSMWDVFLEENDTELENDYEAYDAIAQAVKNNSVQVHHIQKLLPVIQSKLGFKFDFILIDNLKDETSQLNLLHDLSDKISSNEDLIIDVTHGFRHLPMLALVAARYLRFTKQINVDNIYYAAFEMKESEITPAVDLMGMLSMFDWIDALSSYEKDGNYGVFSDLLSKDGFRLELVNEFKKAAQLERINNSAVAAQKLSPVLNELAIHDIGITRLFKDALVKRIGWFKAHSRGHRELNLANEYINKNDYLRAVLFLLEGIISISLHKEKLQDNDLLEREKMHEKLKENNPDYKSLNHIRNNIVHGRSHRINEKTRLIINDPNRLKKELQNILKTYQ